MSPSNPRAREDAVCVNVPGSFTSGRLFLFFFLSFDLLTHRGQSPQGKGERMVMDLQDQSAILEYQGNIRLFGTSSQVLTADDPQDDEEDTIPATTLKVSVPRITTTLKMTLMTVALKTGRKRKISLRSPRFWKIPHRSRKT